jgi:hypothetical protein
MLILISIVLVLLVIGVVVVIRSGGREIRMDEKDRKVAEALEDKLNLPQPETQPIEAEESWTLDSAEDIPTGNDDESE